MSNTKNIARQRIDSLLDANSFVEIGADITARSTDFNLGKVDSPSDGVVTGYGLIDGKLVYVYSQNPEVLNGSIGEMHAEKITRIYNDAVKMGAPVLGCIDCSGLRLEEATDALNGFGKIYMAKAKASGVVLTVDIIFGNCGGGMAAASAMSDFTLMSDKASFYVTSPDAVDNNRADKCDTSSASYLEDVSDSIDMTGSETDIITKARQLISILPGNNEDEAAIDIKDDINRSCEGIERFGKDKDSIIRTIADNGLFIETMPEYAKSMKTGFITLNGSCVGVVANAYSDSDGIKLCPRCTRKAASFIKFCDAYNIPVLTLAEVSGFATGKEADCKMAKALASLVCAYADSTVAKVTVIVGNIYGSASIIMNSKSIGSDFVYAWPGLDMGMMNAESAVKIIYSQEIEKEKDKLKFINTKTNEYKTAYSSVEAAARRGYIDTIIDPADTRKYVISAFEMLYTKREEQIIKKHNALV